MPMKPFIKNNRMKKILIINGHPNKDSFNFGIAKAYQDGALQSGAEVKEIVIADLNFNPNLQFGYQKRMELEPDLVKAWEKYNGRIIWSGFIRFGGEVCRQ